MSNRIVSFVRAGVVLASVFAATSVFASERSLLPATSGDLVAARVVAAERGGIAADERAPLEFFQPLHADAVLHAQTPHQAQSREYWQRVSGDTLRAGFDLALTAEGAVVLISPTVNATPLRRDQVAIGHGGERVAFDQAADTLVDAEALRAAGMEVQAGSVGFRLRPGYARDAELIVDAADGDYVVHVLEPNSDQVLELQARTDTVHAGTELALDLALLGGSRIDSTAAILIAPDGSHQDLGVRAGRTGQALAARVPASIRVQPGLWEVHATVAGNAEGRLFQRDARTAVAVVAPTARLAGGFDQHILRGGGSLVLGFPIEVGTPGRYELRGVLYATDAKGEAVPLGVAHAAGWFEAGQGRLQLSFPVLDRTDARGPFHLRDLQLSDQSAAAVIERRAHALTLD